MKNFSSCGYEAQVSCPARFEILQVHFMWSLMAGSTSVRDFATFELSCKADNQTRKASWDVHSSMLLRVLACDAK